MSNTESFEYALWKSIDDCKIDENTDTITGSYTKSLSNQDRVVAAHIREIRDTAQQEYHRGFEAGRHSMDAEHRAIATRLRQLPLDGGSHENLSQIARAVYHSDFGWTQSACAALRDELVRLMGGVSDENVHVGGLRCDDGCVGDVSNGEDTWRTHDSPSNRDRNHMAVRVGVDTVIGDSDDTCDSQCRGACAAGDCGNHVEQEVTDERVADDCSAAVRCGDGCGGVHMAGVTTYDVLWNERQKAVCELRKLDGCSPTAHNFRDALAASLNVPKDGAPFDDKELCHLICDRLIHLLGGDQPSGIDVLRAMDNNGTMGQDNGTCPDDVPIASITDELREWASDRHCKGMSHTDVLNIGLIADRIDEQFDRICTQHEAVLQSTIDSMCEEQDRLQERLRTAELGCDANHRLAEANARWCDELLDLLRDAANEYVDSNNVWSYALEVSENMRLEGKCNELLTLLRDAAGDYEAVLFERDEARKQNNWLQAKLDAIRDSLDG